MEHCLPFDGTANGHHQIGRLLPGKHPVGMDNNSMRARPHGDLVIKTRGHYLWSIPRQVPTK